MTASIQTLLPTDRGEKIYPQPKNGIHVAAIDRYISRGRSSACHLIRSNSDALVKLALAKLTQLYPELIPSKNMPGYRRELAAVRLNAIQSFFRVILGHLIFILLTDSELTSRQKDTFWKSFRRKKDCEIYRQACVCLKVAIDETMDITVRNHINPFMTTLLELL